MGSQLSKRLLSGGIIAALVLTGTVGQAISVFMNAVPVYAVDNGTGQEEVHITEELTELRDEFSKTYEKSDGTSVSIVSGIPFHYYDEEEGVWEEIDNTLTEENGILSNKNDGFEVNIPKELDDKKGIKVSNGNNNITITPVDHSDSTARIKNQNRKKMSTKIKDLNYTLDDYAQASLSSSEVKYNNVAENTSLQYILTGNTLKENIILSDKPEEAKTYEYMINAQGLTATLKKEGSIVFKNKKDKKIFTMPAPYMYDSAEEKEYSSDIKVSLEKIKGGYKLTYAPSHEWLSDDEREYPVYVDPTVKTETTNIEDTCTISAAPDTLSTYQSNHFDVGAISNGSVVYKSYIKFNKLPTRYWSNSIITKATLNLKTQTAAANNINAYQITSSWTESTLIKNNLPNTSSTTTDYCAVDATANKWFSFDITNLVDGWYNSSSLNHGVKLEAPYSTTSCTNFYSSNNTDTSVIPYLSIEYASMTDISYRNSRDIDVGRAGTVNINDFTGNLRLTRQDIGVAGSIMPVNIAMIYDIYNKDEWIAPYGYGEAVYGTGFRTNYHEKISYVSALDYYQYVSEEGKKVFFQGETNTSGGKVYKDYSNNGYTLQVTGTPTTTYTNVTITDNKGYKHFFDSRGRLVKRADMNLTAVKNAGITAMSNDTVNGIIKINYLNDTNGLYIITSITDGVGRIYQFNYTSGYKLESIAYKGTGNTTLSTVSYNYNSDDTLKSVKCTDGKNVSYTWSSKKLTKVTNTDGYNVNFTYTNEAVPKVLTIKEYASDATLGENVSISYGVCTTTYTDTKTSRKEILQFDKHGNLLSSQDGKGNVLLKKYGNNANSAYKILNTNGYYSTALNDNLLEPNPLNGWNKAFSGAWSIVSGGVNDGNCIKLNSDSMGVNILYKNVKLKSGKTYTFSAYVKTNKATPSINPILANRGAYITANPSDVTVTTNSNYIKGTNGWTRVYTTFDASSDCTVRLQLILEVSNTEAYACFDDIRLEEGTHYQESGKTYLLNSDFNGLTSWTSTSTNSTTSPTINSTKGVYCQSTETTPFDSKSLKLFGDPRYSNNVYQDVAVSGVKGDTYDFGGWAKANTSELKGNRTFGIKIQYYNGSSLVGGPTVVSFAPYITDWQFNMTNATATGTFTKIRITIIYDYQMNSALFDRIQLVKK